MAPWVQDAADDRHEEGCRRERDRCGRCNIGDELLAVLLVRVLVAVTYHPGSLSEVIFFKNILSEISIAQGTQELTLDVHTDSSTFACAKGILHPIYLLQSTSCLAYFAQVWTID
jgi:hypothetical protein